jgi:Fe2+ transport system protein FeoA
MFDEILPLGSLSDHAWAEVVDVCGNSAHVQRLAELGLRPGARLRMIQSGCPCLFELAGARVSIRCDEDLQVLVRSLPEAALAYSEVA